MKTVKIEFPRLTSRTRFPNGTTRYSFQICELGSINSHARTVAAIAWLLEKLGNDPRIEGVSVLVDQAELVRGAQVTYNGVYVRLRLAGSDVPIQVIAGQHVLPDEELRAREKIEKEMGVLGAELQAFVSQLDEHGKPL